MNTILLTLILTSSSYFDVPQQRVFALKVNPAIVEMELQGGSFYMSVSTNWLTAAVTNNAMWNVTALIGGSRTFGRSAGAYWKVDTYFQATPGSFGRRSPYFDFGLGLGIRLETYSGFTFGFKFPLFGFNVDLAGRQNTLAGLVNHYLVSLVTLPHLTIGYRF